MITILKTPLNNQNVCQSYLFVFEAAINLRLTRGGEKNSPTI